MASAVVVLVLLFGVALVRTNIVAVVVHFDRFEGGEISLEGGSSAKIEDGSGTKIVFLKVESATDIKLSCGEGDKIHVEREGYIEPGPTQYLSIELSGCKIYSFGASKDILSFL